MVRGLELTKCSALCLSLLYQSWIYIAIYTALPHESSRFQASTSTIVPEVPVSLLILILPSHALGGLANCIELILRTILSGLRGLRGIVESSV